MKGIRRLQRVLCVRMCVYYGIFQAHHHHSTLRFTPYLRIYQRQCVGYMWVRKLLLVMITHFRTKQMTPLSSKSECDRTLRLILMEEEVMLTDMRDQYDIRWCIFSNLACRDVWQLYFQVHLLCWCYRYEIIKNRINTETIAKHFS